MDEFEMARLRQRARRKAARATGLCLACCTRLPAPGIGSCQPCFDRRRRGYAKEE